MSINSQSSQWSTRRGIRASAGSGKTYSLTATYLRSFLNGADPARMLATTFTRKAAGEILTRVLLRLGQACNDQSMLDTLADELELKGLDRQAFQKELLRLCQAMHQVSISTIDSFFSRLLRSYRYEAGYAADSRLVDGTAPEMTRMRLLAIGDLLASESSVRLIELLDDIRQGRVGRRVAHQLDEKLSSALGMFSTASSSAWVQAPCNDTVLSPAELATCLKGLDNYIVQQRHKSLIKGCTNDHNRAVNGEWLKFLIGGCAAKIAAGESTYYGIQVDPETVAVYEALISHARAHLIAAHNRDTLAIRDLLEMFNNAFTARRQNARTMLYSDIPATLSSLLPTRPFPEIEHRLGGAIGHLLLDEFQDTEPGQYAILKRFANEIHCLDRQKGVIFCVGDMKQSIYGWRGATPEIFERIGTDFSLDWQDNDTSYRSCQDVLDAVNRMFGTLTDNEILAANASAAAAKWQATFRPHTAHPNNPRSGYVELLQSPRSPGSQPDPDDNDEAEDDDESGFVIPNTHLSYSANKIKQLAEQAPNAKIGVLVRRNKTVSDLLFQLKRLGVNASAAGGSAIVDDPAVGVILSAIRFADHPGDTASRFNVSASPLGEHLNVRGVDTTAQDSEALAIRRGLMTLGTASTVLEWAGLLSPHCDARGAERLTQLVELADAFDNRPSARPLDFVEFVTTQTVEEPSPSNVMVMSIHKAKGLEFDIVVMPELPQLMSPTPQLIYNRDPKTLEVTNIVRYPSTNIRAICPDLSNIYDRYHASEVSEALCVLYVGMTRAKRSLHLIVKPLKIRNDGTAYKSGLSLSSIVRSGLGGAAGLTDVSDREIVWSTGSSDWYASEPVTVAENAPVPGNPADMDPVSIDTSSWPPRFSGGPPPSSALHRSQVKVADLLGGQHYHARRRGSAIHALFALVEWSLDTPVDTNTAARSIRSVMPNASDEDIDKWICDFQSICHESGLQTVFTAPASMDGETCEVWRERRYSVRDGDKYLSGIFDRVVVTFKNGRATRADLVDFKTDAADDHGAGEVLTARYAAQVKEYRRALQQMLSLPPEAVTTRLVFVGAASATVVAI